MPVKPTPIFERAMRYVMPEPNSGCWLWIGSVDGKGYGQISTERGRSPARAHRIVYEGTKGLIPSDLDLDHKCRNIVCVNPDHLEPVTRAVNLARGIGGQRCKERAAAKTRCIHGHELLAENIYSYRGQRHCRACRNAAQLRMKEKSLER